MAAARVISFGENVPDQLITINSSFAPSPEGCFIQAGQNVTFTNGSGAVIDIKFAPNPITPTVFTDITGLSPTAPNNTATRAPSSQVPNGSVNYYVYLGGVLQSGPYAIQVGTGPMFVQISTSGGNVVYTPATAAIPHQVSIGGGTLELVSTDYSYNIGPASFSNMFTPHLTQALVSGNNPHTNIGAVGGFDYTATQQQPSPKLGGGGGGKIKVQST
jgi:hypothetical protein